MHACVESGGVEDETYTKALASIQQQSREEGFDAAIRHESASGETFELDALLIFDIKGAGMQLAAQAGQHVELSMGRISLN